MEDLKLSRVEKVFLCIAICLFFFAEGVHVGFHFVWNPPIIASTPDPALSTPEVTSTPVFNLNTVTAAQLCYLPGIGEALAQRIIDYREEIGGFTDTSDIMNVSGIGEVTYENIKRFIYVEEVP